MHHVSVHVSQAAVDGVVSYSKLFVIDTELVKDGSVNVVNRSVVTAILWSKAPLVTFPKGTGLKSSPTYPVREYKRIMVAAFAAL